MDGPQRRSIRLPSHDYAQAGAYFFTICAHGRRCTFADVVDDEVHLSALGQVVQEEWLRSADLRPWLHLDAFVVMPNHIHGIVWIAPQPDVGATHASPAHPEPDVGATRASPAHPEPDVGATPASRAHSEPDVGATRTSPAHPEPDVGATPASPAHPEPCVGATRTSPAGPPPSSLSSFIGGLKSAVARQVNRMRQTPGAPVWQRNYYERVIRDEQELNELRQYVLANPLRWALDRENPAAHFAKGRNGAGDARVAPTG